MGLTGKSNPYFHPETFEALWELLNAQPGALVLAGGTDLVVQLRKGWHRGLAIVDPSGLMRRLRACPKGSLAGAEGENRRRFVGVCSNEREVEIGAFTPFAEILESALVRTEFPVFWEACRWIGSRQIRNMATLGGNLANASPAGDSLPALLLYEAHVMIRCGEGRREVPMGEFHQAYKKTALQPGELIESVRLPRTFESLSHYYRKAGPRKALAIARASVCGAFIRPAGNQTARVRLAAGGVAPVPLRLHRTEGYLNDLSGRGYPDLAGLRAALAQDIAPISDIRGAAAYKFQVVLNFLAEFLKME